LLDLRERCSNGDKEFAERTKMRNTELVAVGDALSILTDDSARDLFSSTLSFFQKGSRQAHAANVLRQVAGKTGSGQLATLATRVTLDPFTKVIGAIDEMVVQLKKEMADEVEQQRFCASELATNDKKQASKKQKIEDLTLSLEDMAGTMATLTKDIATLQEEVATTNRAIKHASEDRQAENSEFQQTVADQRATQMILQKVLDRLGKVYGQGLVQTKQAGKQEPGAAAPPPPAGFKDYKQAEGAGGVLSLIKKIQYDANSLEKEAIQAEQDAQAAYESFVKDSAKAVGAANQAIAAKTEEKAALQSASVEDEGDKKAALVDLEHLSRYAGELHLSCDEVLKNFEVRQTARGQEIEALGDAKAILSGADFD